MNTLSVIKIFLNLHNTAHQKLVRNPWFFYEISAMNKIKALGKHTHVRKRPLKRAKKKPKRLHK